MKRPSAFDEAPSSSKHPNKRLKVYLLSTPTTFFFNLDGNKIERASDASRRAKPPIATAASPPQSTLETRF
jgi:hypothetical protein